VDRFFCAFYIIKGLEHRLVIISGVTIFTLFLSVLDFSFRTGIAYQWKPFSNKNTPELESRLPLYCPAIRRNPLYAKLPVKLT